MSLSVATAEASLPVAWNLYLPEGWAGDGERRARAGVPADVVFRTKPRIALAQIETALAEGVAPGVVLADAGYGNNGALRDGIMALGLDYVVGVLGNTTVWPPGTTPTVPAWRGRGQRPKRLRRGGDGAPVVQLRVVAETLPPEAWRAVTWRHGVAEKLVSRFAALRVRAASGDARRSEPRPEQWLLVEWPEGEPKPNRFWFSTLPRRHPDRTVGIPRQAALADRARLSRVQAGTRPRPLRGARLARLPSPRRFMHRRLRLPGRRAGGDSPLGTRRRRAGRSASRSRRLPTSRRRRFAPSAMSRTRSPPCAGASPEPSPKRCQDVRAAPQTIAPRHTPSTRL